MEYRITKTNPDMGQRYNIDEAAITSEDLKKRLASIGLKLAPFLVIVGKPAKRINDVIGNYEDRIMVLVDINGMHIPFYISTGEGGKEKVASGKWYPFFGIGPDGWLNKTDQDSINAYYGNPQLKAIAQKLDSTLGDLRNTDRSIIGSLLKPSYTTINQDLSPAARNDVDGLRKNVYATLARLGTPIATDPKTVTSTPKPNTRQQYTYISDSDVLLIQIAELNGTVVDLDKGTVSAWDPETVKRLDTYAQKNPTFLKKLGVKTISLNEEEIEQLDENLNKWFKEKWVRFGPDGKIRGDCARGDDSEGKPKCLPQSKAHNLGKQGRKYAASKKRREDPNPERTGKAKNVATKKKTNEEQLDEGIRSTLKKSALGLGAAAALASSPAAAQSVSQPQPATQQATQSDLSQYSIKKLRFGMTPEEVGSITGKIEYDIDKVRADKQEIWAKHRDESLAIGKDTNKRLEQAISGNGDFLQIQRDGNEAIIKWRDDECQQEIDRLEKIEFAIKTGQAGKNYANSVEIPSKYTKQSNDFDYLISDYSIAGYPFWKTLEEDGKLVSLYQTMNPDDISDTLQVFTNVYGKPSVRTQPIQTRMGYRATNIIYTWKVKDVTITLQKYAGRIDRGEISIDWNKADQMRASQRSADVSRGTKDFEESTQIDEKCWDTHKQVGMKNKGGRQVPNCVKNTNEEDGEKCPHCGGELVSEEMMNEKQDACYHKVKSRYKVWPSAYASGALVQCRKKGASNWGTGGKKKNESSIMKGIVGEDLSQADVDGIARFADKLYKKLGIDITFTKHFMDRVNDDRNGKPISGAELVRLFKREYERWGKDVAQMGPDMEGTFKDLTTDINLPFVLRWDRDEKELDLVAKTVMRKKDFKTRNQEFPVDESIAQFGDPIEPGYYVVDKFSDRLVYPERFKTHFDAEGYLLRKIPSRNWNRYEVAYISDETGLVNAENWYGLVKAGIVDPNKITGFVNKQYNESSSPKYMKEATDGRLESDLALLQAKRITKAIKYDNSVNEIITQIQELAERTNGIDMGILEDSISMVSKFAQRLESAVYGLENAFAEAAGNVGLDEAVSGRIYMVRSRDGVEKAFNDRNSVAAKNWENTIAKKPKQPSYSAPKIRKPSSDEIWQKVTTVVANYFPDGDPSDYLYLWAERNKLNWEDVIRAIKKNGYKDLWDYWNALAHDYNSDADHDERVSGGKENRPRAPFMENTSEPNGKFEFRQSKDRPQVARITHNGDTIAYAELSASGNGTWSVAAKNHKLMPKSVPANSKENALKVAKELYAKFGDDMAKEIRTGPIKVDDKGLGNLTTFLSKHNESVGTHKKGANIVESAIMRGIKGENR